MTHDNFDFGGDIADDTDVSPPAFSEDKESLLSVYGLLVNRLGMVRAREVFAALERLANKAAEQNGGVPGIAFDVEGGRFVAIIGGSDDGRGF